MILVHILWHFDFWNSCRRAGIGSRTKRFLGALGKGAPWTMVKLHGLDPVERANGGSCVSRQFELLLYTLCTRCIPDCLSSSRAEAGLPVPRHEG